MSLKVEKTENTNELKLEFIIEAEKFENAMKDVYRKNAKYFMIPGFRKGKAPYEIVEKHYGKEIFYEDAFNEVVPPEYDKELKENNIEAVSRPQIDIQQMEKGKDLIFTAVVQIKPEVKLGQYKGIEIEKIEYNVSDEDVEKELKSMAEKNARLISVEDRPVQKDDIAVIDFEGFVDGKPFDGGKAENYELTIGSNTFIPGFEDQIIGMKIDEEKEIKVTFPKEYFSKDLAGKDATFKVKLHEIKVKELPKIDDDFAKDVSEFETLEELKNSIKEKFEKSNEERAKHEIEDAVLKAVCDNVEVEIPSGMIESETDRRVEDMENRLRYQGIGLEQYLQIIGKDMNSFRKEYEETARESVKSRLVLEKIAETEKIIPDPEKLSENLEELAKAYQKTVDQLKENEELMNYIEKNLTIDNTLKFIVDQAKTTKKATKKTTKKEITKKETTKKTAKEGKKE